MKRKLLLYSLTVASLVILSRPTFAHFPWVTITKDGKVAYFFGENPADRTYKLPATIAKAEVSKISAKGKAGKLQLKSVDSDSFVGLASSDAVDTKSTLISQVTYGLFRGSRLNYYSIHYGGRLPRKLDSKKKVPLDLQAKIVDTDSGVDVFVTWKGKPLAGIDVQLYCDEGHEEGNAKTDQQGKVSFNDKQVEDGLNGVMLGHTVKGESGKFDGKAYDSTAHYLTVTFFDPEDFAKAPAKPAAKKEKANETTAAELRREAHDSREVWHRFPGFTASVTVCSDTSKHTGTIHVTSDFEYELDIAAEAKQPWVRSKLRSVISHRRPSAPREYDVSFVADDASHVSGRLVAHNDGSGMFRIKDGVIREVIRKSDSSWFEITTLGVFETEDGRYLPETTSVSYRDPKTGDILSNRSNRFAWTKVGSFYLPHGASTIEVGAGGNRTVRKISFADHKLTTKSATANTILHKPLEEPLTSFGAAVLGEYLYVFSGHDGAAHGFGRDALADHFRRIKFDDPNAEWEELAKHEPAQSTALLTDGKYLYRIGGLTFLNRGEEETNFKSTTHFARYDVEKNKWTDLAPLPEPRSSLDAAVVGRSIYVAAGWNLQGESSRDAHWFEDILHFDLDNPSAGWKSLPGPGYITRAASVAAHKGKLYLFGGIQKRSITRKVSVFDPKTGSWSEAPELKPDSRTAGFATSSFATGGRLYCTGGSGVVYRLMEDDYDWEIAGRLMFPRMFLRLLPASDDRLLALGGTSSVGGRMAVVESFEVSDHSAQFRSIGWSHKFGGRAKHSQTLVLKGPKLYAFGGNASRQPHDFSKEAFVGESYVFDIPNQTIERLPDLPSPLQSGAGLVYSQTSEHKMIVLGGGLGMRGERFGSLDQIFTFDTEAKSWSTAAARLPAPRAMFRAATHDDAIWFFGGSDAGHGSGLRSPVLHWWGDETAVTPLPNSDIPTPRRSFGGATVGNEYFMVGGLTDKTGLADTVDVFSFEDRSWRQVAAPSVARVFPSLAATKDKLYLFGGFTRADGHFAPATSLEVYDVKHNKWRTVADKVPGIDQSMSMLGLGGRLLFYGIDREVDGRANFVLLDPEPMADPGKVEAFSFGSRRRGSDVTKNAKALMRKDTDKNGKLTRAELGSRLVSLLERGDENGDGELTYAETKAVLERKEKENEDQN